jgi:hypothetical protein
MVRQDCYEFRCREWNVQEKPDAVGMATFSKFFPERDEVVIMDPK